MSVGGNRLFPGLGVGDGEGALFPGTALTDGKGRLFPGPGLGLTDGKDRALARLGMGGGSGGDVEAQGGRAGGASVDLHPVQLFLGTQPDVRAVGRRSPRHLQHDGGRFAPGGGTGTGPRGVTAAQLGRHRAQCPQQQGEQGHQRGRDDGRLGGDIAPFASTATFTAAH
jgi:hypothetical protein